MPLAIACLSCGHRAAGSLPAITFALAPVWMAVWIAGSCAAAVSFVPDWTTCLLPIFVSASLPPRSAMTSYGFSVSFGMKYTVWPLFSELVAWAEIAVPITPTATTVAITATRRARRPRVNSMGGTPFLRGTNRGFLGARRRTHRRPDMNSPRQGSYDLFDGGRASFLRAMRSECFATRAIPTQ